MTTKALPLFIAALVGVISFSGGRAAGEALSVFVRGQSGSTWETRYVKTVGDYSFIDVFFEGARVLRYKQKGEDKSTRVLVDYPPSTPLALLDRARKDFGV